MREAHIVQWIEGGNFLDDFLATLFSCPAFSTESTYNAPLNSGAPVRYSPRAYRLKSAAKREEAPLS